MSNDIKVHDMIQLCDDLGELDQRLAKEKDQAAREALIKAFFTTTPVELDGIADGYYKWVSLKMIDQIKRTYVEGQRNLCIWRFIKKLPPQELSFTKEANPDIYIFYSLLKIYFYSDPLEDLSCIFVPIGDSGLIPEYLGWIKTNFYSSNYPTSLLWMYALDSTHLAMFPDEMIFLGQCRDKVDKDIVVPNDAYEECHLLKKFNQQADGCSELTGHIASLDFNVYFSFLKKDYKNRCLCDNFKEVTRARKRDQFKDVLQFGVTDSTESGSISFTDIRSSTRFLRYHGKSLFLNLVLQPFFESTKIIDSQYYGRIDKFIGDNVMCVFLDSNNNYKDKKTFSVLSNFFAILSVYRNFFKICMSLPYDTSYLGLRTGFAYGSQILRSNLGNEIVRDFTVTGDTVNFSARLEHIPIRDLILESRQFFESDIERFADIVKILEVGKDPLALNDQSSATLQKYALYQNIVSCLEKLKAVLYDIRINDEAYAVIREHLISKGLVPDEKVDPMTYGYERFVAGDRSLNFYFSYYVPKGFEHFERIWIMPLETHHFTDFDFNALKPDWLR